MRFFYRGEGGNKNEKKEKSHTCEQKRALKRRVCPNLRFPYSAVVTWANNAFHTPLVLPPPPPFSHVQKVNPVAPIWPMRYDHCRNRFVLSFIWLGGPTPYFFSATWLKLSSTLSFRSPLFSLANSSEGVPVTVSASLLEDDGRSCLAKTFA